MKCVGLRVSSALLGLAALQLAGPAFAQVENEEAVEAEASADESAEVRLALAHEIIDIGMPAEMREQMFFATVDQMTSQMRSAAMKNMDASDPGLVAILDRWLDDWIANGKDILRGHIPSLMNGWAAAYADIFTEAELRDLLDFVQTPTGAKFFRRMPDIMSNPHFAKANQDYIDEIMADLSLAQIELSSELIEYLAEKDAAAAP